MAAGAKGRKRSVGRALPAVYLLLAMALAVAVLPTVLRPPPEQQQSSAALNPNAPPEEEAETIIQSLRQAASRTAGATGGQQEAAPATTTTTIVKPGRGRCFGDPPRQTESPYSPPCRAAFTGDNGGGTWTNVTGEEIRVSFWHVLGMPAERGPIEDTAPPGEDAAHRTARVLQQYFNERYEMYGRRLRFWAIEDNGDTEGEQRASAVRQAVENRAFIATHLSAPFCDEFTRRELVCFNGNGFQKSVYEEHSPYWWSYQMDTDTVDQISGEYICKKLHGRNADFAGSGLQGLPRKIAVLTESTLNNNFRTAGTVARNARDICGFDPFTIDFDGAKPEQIASALAQVRAGGYTTIVLTSSLVPVLQFFAGADANQYFPEWVMINSYGLDFNDAARLTGAPRQLEHLFGMSGWELPQPFEDTDCYRAYKSVDPTTNPDANFCRLHWIDLEHIANGIQEAGPDLTPESFRDGLYAMPLRDAKTDYAIGGGYSPGDHAFVDNLAEIWWDPTCTDIDGGEPGCYLHTQGGKRFRPGELDDVVRVFSEGVRGYERTQ